MQTQSIQIIVKYFNILHDNQTSIYSPLESRNLPWFINLTMEYRN